MTGHASGDGGKQRAEREAAAAQGTPAKPDQPVKNPIGCGGCLVMIGVLALGGYALANCGGNDEPSETLMQIQAEDQCKDWVKDKLKAPATADFSGERISGTAGDYTIVGNVDSQNSFGANVRSTWMCTIKRDSTGTYIGEATVNG